MLEVMSISEYSVLLSELQRLSISIPKDEETRHKIFDALQQAGRGLETPLDVVRRISYSPLQLVAAKVAVDLGIFDILDRAETCSLDEIVSRTGGERDLLVRILRYLASTGLAAQCTETTFAASEITRTLNQSGFRAAINHYFDVQLPVWLALPSFLASTSYNSPSSSTQTAFQKAHSTSLHPFEWASTRSKLMHDFAQWMAVQREEHELWFKAFTHEDLLGDQMKEECKAGPVKEGRVFFVDIGGGLGQQCRALRSFLPSSLPADTKIIFQDLPSVISLADGSTEGVQAMVHDMFKPQPVKDAKFYYMRNILHDWDTASCISILRNIVSAMGPRSSLLIDELILPDMVSRASRDAEVTAALDVILMANLAGRERTMSVWEVLLNEAGLYVEEVRRYDRLGNSIIVVKAC